MKKKLLIAAAAIALAAAVITVVVLVRKNSTQTVLSDVYKDKEYVEKINAVEINEDLAAAVDGDDLYKVKMAVLENSITAENEEKLADMIKKYGVENTLISYSYLNTELVTWDDMEQFIKTVDKKGVSKAIKEYDKSAQDYVPSTFKRSQLEDWITVKGYPAGDITTLDKLSKLYEKSFDELMAEYESDKNIGEIKAELGLVNTNPEIEYVTITEDASKLLSEKCGIDETRADTILSKLVRLNFDIEKLSELNFSSEYELLTMVLEEKYGGEGK